jgi:hypothetical protein
MQLVEQCGVNEEQRGHNRWRSRGRTGTIREYLAVEAQRETKIPTVGGLVAQRHASSRDVTCGPGKNPGLSDPGRWTLST